VLRDGAAGLEAIDRAAQAGEDLLLLCREVIETVRRLLVVKVGPANVFADLTPAEAESLRAAGETATTDELIYLLRAFLEADAEMRRSPYPRVELEIAAVRATRRPVPQALDTLLAKVEDALGRLRTSPGAASGQGAVTGRPVVVQESLLAPPPGPVASVRASVPVPETTAERAPALGAADAAAAGLAGAWGRVVAEIVGKKPMLGSVLQNATPLGLADGVLTLTLAGNHFHAEMLADRANRELITQVLQQQLPEARRFELDASGSGGGAGARNHPAVQAALNVFPGEVVAVRPRAPEEGEPQ